MPALIISTDWRTDRALVGSLTRSRPPDDPDLLAARRRLALRKAVRDLRAVAGVQPPLSTAELDELVAILREAVPHGAA